MLRHVASMAAVVALLGSLASCGGGKPVAGDEPLDLVVMAASGGAGVAERYGPLVADALDREVRTHAKIGARPTEILEGAEGSWAELVAGAEIIVFNFPPGGFEPPSHLTCLEALDAVTDPDYSGPAWTPGQTWDPPAVTSVEDWQGWREALRREYEAIWTLREDRPTILRAYGGWNPWIPVWRQVGIERECSANEAALDQAMREAAATGGAVYVSMLDVFTGPGRDQDPAERGWIDDDGMHLSDEGVDVLVNALAAAGFEVNESPR